VSARAGRHPLRRASTLGRPSAGQGLGQRAALRRTTVIRATADRFGERGCRRLPPAQWSRTTNGGRLRLRYERPLKRLAAACQVLRPNDTYRLNLPFAVPRGDRPLHPQQRSLNSDVTDARPNDSCPQWRSALRDPNLTAGLLQSGPTASHDFSCFASTKRPFVISHTRPSVDVYGDRVGDGTRLGAAVRIRRANVSSRRNLPLRSRSGG